MAFVSWYGIIQEGENWIAPLDRALFNRFILLDDIKFKVIISPSLYFNQHALSLLPDKAQKLHFSPFTRK